MEWDREFLGKSANNDLLRMLNNSKMRCGDFLKIRTDNLNLMPLMIFWLSSHLGEVRVRWLLFRLGFPAHSSHLVSSVPTCYCRSGVSVFYALAPVFMSTVHAQVV